MRCKSFFKYLAIKDVVGDTTKDFEVGLKAKSKAKGPSIDDFSSLSNSLSMEKKA